MKKRHILALAAVTVGLAATSAVAKDWDRLVVANQYDVTSMDPIGHNDVPSSTCCKHIYDTLIYRDYENTVHPMLAERWDFPSPNELKLYIRKGVKFHNGNDLTAEDVAFTFMRAASEKGAKIRSYSQNIKACHVIDDYTVVIELKKPDSSFFNSLSHPWSSILDKETVEAAGDNYGTLVNPPVGTGPYKYDSWLKNDKYTLVAVDNYWGADLGEEYLSQPSIKYIEVRSIPESNNRSIELETGAVDVSFPIVVSDINRIKDNPELDLYQVPGVNVTYMGFNYQKAPFNDVRVRQGIRAAIDTAIAHKAVFEKLGKNGYVPRTMVPAALPYSIADEVPAHKQDVKLAEKLLKEANFDFSKTYQIWTNERKERQDLAQIIQAFLAEIGVKTEIQVLEWGAYLTGLQEMNHDMFLLGWSTSIPDPNYAMSGLLETDAGSNYTFFSEEAFDHAMDMGRQTEDGPERAALYREAQEILLDKCPMVYLHSDDNCVGAQKYVKNLHVTGDDSYAFRGVYFEK